MWLKKLRYLFVLDNEEEIELLQSKLNMSGLAKTYVKSAWTPLNNDKANRKVSNKIVMVREIYDSCQDMFVKKLVHVFYQSRINCTCICK